MLTVVRCIPWYSLSFFITLLQRNDPSLVEVEAGGKGDTSDALALALQEKVFTPSSHLFLISMYLVFFFLHNFFNDQSICASDLW